MFIIQTRMMFILFFITNIISLSAATEEEQASFFNVGAGTKNNRGLVNTYESLNKPLLYNSTYLEKEENLLRVPNNYHEENKNKKKMKKPPKRTVQKIIKKNKFKTRKLYLFPATLLPTLASKPQSFNDRSYTGQSISTTENNFKKRSRKNQKFVRYPMPFQKLQRREGAHSRFRREERDVYILKDFDEMKFLSKEKDHDKVLAHVQKYW